MSGPPFPEMSQVLLQFSQPLEKSKFLSRLNGTHTQHLRPGTLRQQPEWIVAVSTGSLKLMVRFNEAPIGVN